MDIKELEDYRLSDAVKFHTQLNPRIWGRDEHLLPEVREKLLAIAADFKEFLGLNLEVTDITISGSNAAYTYTDHSDIDLHLVTDLPKADASDVYRELFDAKKYQYNDQHNFKIGGYDVELYVQNANQDPKSQGIYSVQDNEWISVPKRRKPDVDDISVKSKYEDLGQRIEAAIKSGDATQLETLGKKVREFRQAGLDRTGEFGPENLAFKVLRSNGTLDQLRAARLAARDQELSIAEAGKKKKKKSFRYGFGGYYFPGYHYYGQTDAAADGGDGGGDGGGESVRESVDDLQTQLEKFAAFCVKKLGIQNPPGIQLKRDPAWSQRNSTFGRYMPETNAMILSVADRHPMDIMRTLAHELVHRQQDEQEPMPGHAGNTGSDWENEANARAGVLMRSYGEQNPGMFDRKPLGEGKESNIVWVKPNFDYEWVEIEFQADAPQVPSDVRNYMAKHFPDKQAWMKSVQHGRPVVVSPNHGQKIRNYTDNKRDLLNALSPASHNPQGPAKEKRVNALFDKGGPIEMPIILQTEKGLWLIGGNTRLGTANLLRGMPAKVWLIGGQQGVAEGLTEARNSLFAFVKQHFPSWPDYVLRDFLYQQAKGIRDQAELDDFLKRNKQDFGNCKWTLTNLPITFDIFTPKTQRMLASREGGSSNPFQVPRDAERHAQQSKMIQQKGVSTEPIIVAKLSNGYDLIEGWHRTIQHLKTFPEGYTGPAWVCTGATYKSESVNQGVAEASEQSLSSMVAQDQAEGLRQKLNFDEIYGKYLKVTVNDGDPNKKGFSLVTPLNGESWNWRERPEKKALVKRKLNEPGWLGDYKYQQIIDAMAGKPFDPARHMAEGSSNSPQTVTRIDSQEIKDFGSNLKGYKHTDDWAQSGIDTGDDSYWQKKNLKTNTTKGLFAGDPHRTALYATGNAHETRYVEFTQNGQPIVYFDKKDLPKMRGRRTYLTVFDAANFRKLPTGEYFSENPGTPLKQTVINDPFQYIADQGWVVRITADLNKVFKQVQSMHKTGKIPQYGAEGMAESVQQVVAEASGYIPVNDAEARDPRYSMAITQDIRPGEVKRQAAKMGWKTTPAGTPPTARTNGLVEELTRKLQLVKEGVDFPLVNEQELEEVAMSPSALRAFATSEAAAGMQAGFEAELVFAGALEGSDESGEMEPDYDMDERASDIDSIMDFFSHGDMAGISSNTSSPSYQRARNQLEEDWFEWYSERLNEDFAEDQETLIENWIMENDWDQDQHIEEFLKEELELSADEIREVDAAMERRMDGKGTAADADLVYKYNEAVAGVKEQIELRVTDAIEEQNDDYESALEEFRSDYDAVDEQDWLSARGWRRMSDISNNFDFEWPYWTSGFGDNEEGGYNPDVARRLASSLSDTLGVKTTVSSGYHSAKRDTTTWIFEPDGSLDADDSDAMPVEIVSPPMPLSKTLEILPKFFEWAAENDAYANDSTGFHMSVSMGDHENNVLDFTKLALFLGDEYVLQQFGREANTYAKSALQKIREKKGNVKAEEILSTMRRHLSQFASRALASPSGFGKYTSINPKNNYIEFRSAGGSNYFEDMDKIQNTLMRYARAMDIAMDPAADKPEYAKKLYKLLTDVKTQQTVDPKTGTRRTEVVSGTDNDAISIFSRYVAGQLPKSELKGFLKKLQYGREVAKNPPKEKIQWRVTLPNGRATITLMAASAAEAIKLAKQEYNDTMNPDDAYRAEPVVPAAQTPATDQLNAPAADDPRGNFVLRRREGNEGVGPVLFRFSAGTTGDAITAARRWTEARGVERRSVYLDSIESLSPEELNAGPVRATLGEPRPAFTEPRSSSIPEVPLDIAQNFQEPPASWDSGSPIVSEPQNFPAARSAAGNEFSGEWKVVDGLNREVYRFGGIGNSQSDANRVAREWAQRTGFDGNLEVYPVMR